MKLASLKIESSELDLRDLSARNLLAEPDCDVRDAHAADRLEATAGRQCFRPSTVEGVAEVISAAAEEGAALLISAGRTRMHWANPARPLAAGLSLEGLSGVVEFEPDEGVLKARAGTRIAELQKCAAAEGWELPLDPPSAATSTVGGTISSAATGPRAHGLGRVADALLGLSLVGADGVPSKCGGRVVKNVTGYDMAKLYCGAFGTLGVVTSAWLRLHPEPSRLRTLEAELPANAESFALCQRLSKQQSVRAFVWEEAARTDGLANIVIEWGGSAEGVDHDHAETEAAFASAIGGAAERGVDTRDDDRGVVDQIRDARAALGGDDEVVLRARVLGTSTFDFVRSIREAGLSVSVDVGLGAIQARGELGEPDAVLAMRRQAANGSGHLFCESMPSLWRGEMDAFGATGETAPLMAVLKKRFDPAGILNPGRFVVGD